MAIVMLAFQWAYPWRYQTQSTRSRWPGFRRGDFYLAENFGEIDVDFAQGKLTTRVLDAHTGTAVLEKDWELSALDQGTNGGICEAPQPSTCRPHRGYASAPRRLLGWIVAFFVGISLLSWKPLIAVGMIAYARRRTRRAKSDAATATAQ
jgi:hypothetical protein